MGLGVSGGDISTSSPDSRHDAQLFGNFVERGILRESLKCIEYSLLIRHDRSLPCFDSGLKSAHSVQKFGTLLTRVRDVLGQMGISYINADSGKEISSC